MFSNGLLITLITFAFVSVNNQSCLVNMPSSSDEINKLKGGKKTELDAIVTENSNSYFIHY